MATQEELDRGDVLPDETAEETEEETTEEEGTEEVVEEPETDEPDSGDSAEDADAEPDTEEVEEEEDDSEDLEPQGHMLPKSRYDTVQKRNRALQEKIDRMERERESMLEAQKDKGTPGESTTESTKLAELDDKINDALLDGDKALASQLRAEQRKIEVEMIRAEVQESAQSATTMAREQVRLDAAVDFLEATYDELNPDADTFDQKTVDEMETLRHAFVASGDYSPSQALLKAAKYVFPEAQMYDIPPTNSKPAKKNAIKDAVRASNKQPPDISDVGDDADAAGIKDDIDAMALTEKDFDSLPEATLKRLRGDLV